MAKQTIFRGTVANDGTGDNLREGARITNENFDEIYTAFGDGTNLISGTLLTTTNSESVTNKTFDTTNTFPTLSITADDSSAQTISLGGSILFTGGSGITTSISGNEITFATDGSIVTETSSDVLQNKTISGLNNTLSNIGNASLTNSSITLIDDTSTTDAVSLGESLRLTGGTGITSVVGSNEVTFNIDSTVATLTGSQELTNKTINASSNTISNIVNANLSGSAAISNTNLANPNVTIGDDTISLGSTQTTITNLSLDGSTGTIDLTSSGNKLKFNFAGFGSLPTAATYEGMFAYDTVGQVPYVADTGGWTRLQTENDSISVHSDVNITGIADGYILQWSSAQARFNVVANTATTPILKFSDDTSTVGRVNADDVQILGFVGGTGISTIINDANNTVTYNLEDTAVSPNTYGSSTAVPVLTIDQQGRITNATTSNISTDLTVSDDSSTQGTISLASDVLGLVGGTGISTTVNPSNKTITITNTKTFTTDKSNTGDGSTQAFTINSGRTVDDILVIVNGIVLTPTDDYTVSGTTLTFTSAPAASAGIVFRYLG